MIFDDRNVPSFHIHLDDHVVLHIANTRVPPDRRRFAVQAEFDGKECSLQYFDDAKEILKKYHIHNQETCDAIRRILDFIDDSL